MEITMFEAQIRFPVTCPECGREGLSSLSIIEACGALGSGATLKLRSACHAAEWDATPREMEQVREYLDVVRANGDAAIES
jgi:hypothetical protein